MKPPRRVLHLVGSTVSDFHAELSRLYARDCLEATADPSAYDVHIAYVAPDGSWCFPASLDQESIAEARPRTLPEALAEVTRRGIEVVVPQMFCLPGMTAYRALFDVLGIPYLGNPADVMALGADKARTRAVVAAAGVAVPAGQVLRAGERPVLGQGLDLPLVTKPVDADNSLGVSLVRDPAELDTALDWAFAESDAVLAESYVELGREVRCGVLERDGALVCLPLEEYHVDTEHKPIRDRTDKLRVGASGDLELVAKTSAYSWIVEPAADDGPPDPVTERVHAAARASHRALGCRHYSLFDFRIDPDGEPWFLEAGLYCSFARQSVVAVMAEAAGIPVAELFAGVVADALRPSA